MPRITFLACSLIALLCLPLGADDEKESPAPRGSVLRVKAPTETQQPGVTALTFSPRADRLAVGRADGSVSVIDAATGETLGTSNDHRGAVLTLAFDRFGTNLTSVDADGAIRVGDGKTGKDEPGDVLHRDTAAIFDNAGRQPATAAAISPDGRTVALARGETDVAISLRTTRTGKEVQQLPGHAKTVTGLTFTPDGKLLLSSGRDYRVSFWMPARKRAVEYWKMEMEKSPLPNGPYFQTVAISPDGKMAAASYWHESGDRLIVWNRHIAEKLKRFEVSHARAVAFSPDKKTLATAGDDGVTRIWPHEAFETVHEFRGPRKRIDALAYTNDGKKLAAGYRDGSVIVWDTSGVKVEEEEEE